MDFFLDLIFNFTLSGGTRQERKNAESDYEKSAQIVKIAHRSSPFFAGWTSPNNFITLHEKYVNPDYILQHDNIQLQFVTKSHAYFSVMNPAYSFYVSPATPFSFITQFLFAEEFVILPLPSLERLTEKLGNPEEDLIFISNTARCGSILLSQILAKVPNTRVITEEMAVTNVHGMYNSKEISKEKLRSLLQCIVRILCKKNNSSFHERTVIKMGYLTTPTEKELKSLFPDAKFVFTTRMPKPSIASFEKVVQTTPGLYATLRIGTRYFIKCMPYPYDNERLQQQLQKEFNPIRVWQLGKNPELIAITYAGALQCFLENKDMYDYVVLYENWATDKDNMAKELFEVLDISLGHVQGALEAMDSHSQNNMFGSSGGALKDDDPIWNNCDSAFRAVGVPLSINSNLEDYKKILE